MQKGGQPPVRGTNPGKYGKWLTEDGLLLLQGWARAGLTDAQIAHNCGIDVRTLARWKQDHSQICHALKEGKEVVDLKVENALYKRALGYTYEEKTWERGLMDDGKIGLVLTKVVVKEVVADTTAQIYWLKNRKRDTWKESHDRYEIEKAKLELEKQRTEADLNRTDGPKTIEVLMDPEIESWGH